MSIIDLISIGNTVIGLTQDGYLLSWNISPQSLAKEDLRNCPYVGHQFEYQIKSSKPICLKQTDTDIIIVSQKQLTIINICDLSTQIKKYKNQIHKPQLASKVLATEHIISAAQIISLKSDMIDQNQNQTNTNNHKSQHAQIIYATKSGQIFCTRNNFLQSTPICSIKSLESTRLQSYATSIHIYRENTLALIGTSCGRILICSLIENRIVEDVTARQNLKLMAVERIYVGTGSHRFYTLHQNCIVEWSMQLQKGIGYYLFNRPYSILISDKLSLNSSRILVTGGNRCIELIDPLNPKNSISYETNLDSIHVLKQFNGKIYCGGSHSEIEIVSGGVSWVVLFRQG